MNVGEFPLTTLVDTTLDDPVWCEITDSCYAWHFEGLASLTPKGFEARWAVGTMSARKLPLGAFAPWTGSATADAVHGAGVL